MTQENQELKTLINRQRADLVTTQMLLLAVARQVPDVEKLIQDFAQMTEDHAVHAMYSSGPESFFQQLQACRTTLLEQLRDIADSR
jgi:hypothetical protein